MGQKVIIRFWWESGWSSASRNQLITFCRSFSLYACLINEFTALLDECSSLIDVVWLWKIWNL